MQLISLRAQLACALLVPAFALSACGGGSGGGGGFTGLPGTVTPPVTTPTTPPDTGTKPELRCAP